MLARGFYLVSLPIIEPRSEMCIQCIATIVYAAAGEFTNQWVCCMFIARQHVHAFLKAHNLVMLMMYVNLLAI